MEDSKILLDSNIIIALVKRLLPISIIERLELFVSEITRLEVYGYHKLSDLEANYLDQFFRNIVCVDISKNVINQAIILRNKKKDERWRCHYRSHRNFGGDSIAYNE